MKRTRFYQLRFFVTVAFFVAACAIAQAQLNFEGYRGPGRDGIAPADVGLADSWADLPGGKPVLLWQSEDLGIIGIDHTNGQVAVWDGYSYTITYKDGKRVVWCFDSQGRTQWSKTTSYSYPGTHAANPSVWVTDGKVYFHDNSYEYCCDAYSGAEIWKSPRVSEQKTSPVVVDGVYVNRQTNYVGLNAETGKLIWSIPTGDGSVGSAVLWKTPAKTYVVLNLDENNNVSCVDPLTGSVVWSVNPPGAGNDGAPNTSPLCLNDVMVLTTRNLDVDQPQVCYRLFPDDPTRQPELMWANGYETTKSCPVIFEGHIYWGWTTRENSFAQCTQISNGTVKYRVNNPASLPRCLKGYGDLLLADGKLFGNTCLSTTMAWPDSTQLNVIGSFSNNANHQTTPTIVNGLMYVITYSGYSTGGETVARVKCYDIKAPAGSVPRITQTRLRTGKVGSWYTERLWVSSGNGLRTWSLQSGTLPPGLVLDGQNHILSGYPTASGTFSFTLKVTDANGDSDSKPFTIVITNGEPVIPVTSVSVSNCPSQSLTVGSTVDLDAIVLPADATNKGTNWSSDKPSVASVDVSSGLVTAHSQGSALITVTTVDGAKTAVCSVSVSGEDVLCVKASAGPGGIVIPSGDVFADGEVTITIIPDPGYRVADVLVDAVSVGAVTTYTIICDGTTHTLHATFTPLSPSSFRYLKFAVTAAQADRFRLAEIDYKAGGVYYPTQNMTSATAPSPLVVTSSVATGNYKLYDGSTTTEAFNLASATYVPYWNVIDLGAGNEIAPEEVRIVSGSTATGKGPKDFTVEGSNDGTNWTTLFVVTGETNWGIYTTYTFPISAPKMESLLDVDNVENSENVLLVYPNPSADGSVRIATPQRAVIHVFNSIGLLVQTVVCDGQAEVSGLASGVYVLKAIGTDFAKSRTLIVR